MHNFKIGSFKMFKTTRTIRDQYEFLKIPVMTSVRFLGISCSKRMEILNKTYKRANKSAKLISRWAYFVTKKIDS